MTNCIIWKHAPGYVNIQVNQLGQVRDSGTHELLPLQTNNDYHRVRCKRVGATKNAQAYVHALVMLAFKGERPEGHQIDHKDGDRGNNVISNLHYVLPTQNMRNRKDQIIVTYNGKQTVLIDALEDMFTTDCVTAINGKYGFNLYGRIVMMMRRGRTFEQAIAYEINKRGWPVPASEGV